MKKGILFLSLSILAFTSFSQKQTDQWRFGNNAALDFTSGTPVVVNGGAYSIPEGCASIATGTGTLLFYTDGVTVWDTTHAAMPNGTGLTGDISSTQSALIVPSPSNVSQYYVFTTPADGGTNGFRYSMVDMTLHGGLGDVTTKNSLIVDSVTEKVSAVRDAAGTGYWVVCHRWGSNAFNAYHLTASGLSAATVSHAGITYTTTAIQNTYGQMKFSACGSKLALAAGYLDTAEVFNFNISTGVVSNPVNIPMYSHVYGIEFSANSNLLYVSCYSTGGTLVQFDISLSTTSAIIASYTPLSITSDIYGLQMASDGKIYVVKSFSQFLGVINSPDVAGAGCNYVDAGFDLDPHFVGNTSGLGLPGFMQSFLNTSISCSADGIIENVNDNAMGLIYPNPSANEFTFEFPNETISSEITITDCTGRLIQQKNNVTSSFVFGENYDAGIYFVNVKNDTFVKVFRVVKVR